MMAILITEKATKKKVAVNLNNYHKTGELAPLFYYTFVHAAVFP